MVSPQLHYRMRDYLKQTQKKNTQYAMRNYPKQPKQAEPPNQANQPHQAQGAQETQLQVLRLLQSNPQMTQRELAKGLGISLGKANYVLKALMNQGWVKLGNFGNNPSKRDYLYLLTPSGVAGKAGLVADFLARKGAEYELLRKELQGFGEIRDNGSLDSPNPEASQG